MEVSIAEFMAKTPDAKWLRVTGGELDTLNSVYPTGISKGDAKEIYVPVMEPGNDSTEGAIKLLLLTKDPELVGLVNEAKQVDDDPSPERLKTFLASRAAQLRPQKSVEGLVQFGIQSDSKRRAKIGKIYANLASDAVILEDGKKPSPGKGSVLVLGGLGLGGVLLRRGKKSSPPPMPPAPGA